MARSFTQYQPIYKIDDGVIFNRRGEYSIGFKATLREIFTLDKNDYKKINTLWETVIRLLPNYSVIHKRDHFSDECYQIDKKMMSNYFSRSFELAFNQVPFMAHECHIFFIKTTQNVKFRRSDTSLFTSSSLLPPDLKDTNSFNEFCHTISNIVELLNSSGYFKLEKLTDEEYFPEGEKTGILNQFATFSKAQEIVDFSLDNSLKIGSNKINIISISDLEYFPDNLRLCNQDNVYKVPLSFVYPVSIGLKCQHIYNQYIFKDEFADTIDEKTKMRNRLGAFSGDNSVNGTNHKKLSAFLDEVTDGELPVRWHGNIIVWGESDEMLDRRTKLANSALNKMGFIGHLEMLDLGVLYFANFPGNGADIPRDKTCTLTAKQALTLFNCETNNISSKSDYGLKVCDRVNNAPVHIDITELPYKNGVIHNRNKFICSPSGTGKSFLANLLVNSELRMGNHVVVVDKGRSFYQHNQVYESETGSAVFFEFNDEKDLAFNPFYFEDWNDINARIEDDKVGNIASIIFTLWLGEKQEPTPNQEAQLNEYIFGYYKTIRKKQSVFPCFDSFYTYIEKVFSIHKESNDPRLRYFDFDDFLIVMKRYLTGGQYGSLLNARENIDILHKQFVVFETDKIADKKGILAITVMMLMSMFMDKLYKLDGTILKSIYLEEVWSALMTERFSIFMRWMTKTLRKHNASLVSVSQELEDFLGNPIVKKSLVSNSPVKIIGDLSDYKEHLNEVVELIGLGELNATQLTSLNKEVIDKRYREFLFIVGKDSNVYRIIPSDEQLYGFSTDKTEQTELLALKNKYGNYQEAIEIYSQMK